MVFQVNAGLSDVNVHAKCSIEMKMLALFLEFVSVHLTHGLVAIFGSRDCVWQA